MDPAIVTDVPMAPEFGVRLVILGGGTVTVKVTPLLATLFTVTMTAPVVAPAGTGAVILAAVQFVGAAVVPLNLTVLVPCVVPKFDPLMVTTVVTKPEVGFRETIFGTVPPLPPAARKATICIIHGWVLSSAAVAL